MARLRMLHRVLVRLRRVSRLVNAFFIYGRFFAIAFNWLCKVSGRANTLWKPVFIQIEPTNICNLACELCPVGNNTLNRDRGNMGMREFKNLINENYKSLGYIVLYNLGEPFLNDNIFDMISFAVSKRIYVKISTNGFFTSRDIMPRIIDSGLDELLISLDFNDRHTYFEFKNKDVFMEIGENINTLLKLRGTSTRPFIAVQYLAVDANMLEGAQMKDFPHMSSADQILIKKVRIDSNISSKYHGILPRNIKYIREAYVKNSKLGTNGCIRPWISMCVLWDGRVVPCCFDFNGDYTMGNINDSCVADLWNNNAFIKFRQMSSESNNPPDICLNCSAKSFHKNFVNIG
jgi:radical SAM protein with 4Fe4S-binding SPASM domain